MPASFQEILNSRIFKFTVGEEADGFTTEFSVHEEAIAQLSEPLQRMMEGGKGGKFNEAVTGATSWPDVGKETFEQFVQFAYTGDYPIPEPVAYENGKNQIVSPSPVSASEFERMNEEVHGNSLASLPVGDWSSLRPPKKKGKAVAPFRWGDPIQPPEPIEFCERYPEWPGPRLAEDFRTLSYPLAPSNKLRGSCQPTSTFDKDKDYSNVLLSHCSLYLLGDLWLIDSLKSMALFRLHKTLCVFQLESASNIKDILDLVRYVYRDEGDVCEKGIRELRDLVCQYLTSNAVVLTLDNGFMELLAKGGQFVKDLWMLEVQSQH